MRIFIGLDIEYEIRRRITTFMEGVKGLAPDVRWVSPESLHVTLKFIGEAAPEKVEEIKAALHGLQAAPTEVAFSGAGFFPTARAARVFWIGIEADPHLAALARKIDDATRVLGIPSEQRPFSPHLTLARAGSGRPQRVLSDRPNPNFKRLQEKLQAMSPPDFGRMTAREFFLYESRLSPKGAQYTKLERFALESH